MQVNGSKEERSMTSRLYAIDSHLHRTRVHVGNRGADTVASRHHGRRWLRLRWLALTLLLLVTVSARVEAQPVNDDCGSPTVIGTMPFADTLDTGGATTAGSDPAQS